MQTVHPVCNKKWRASLKTIIQRTFDLEGMMDVFLKFYSRFVGTVSRDEHRNQENLQVNESSRIFLEQYHYHTKVVFS